MSRIRTLVAVLVIALPVLAFVAGCGGGSNGSDEDPQQVLDQTFDNPTKVTSGNLNLTLSGSAEGAQSGNATATIEGPFQGDPNDSSVFPQLDLTAKISASGLGQSFNFDGSLITTEDNAFVEYQGQAYEVGTALFGQFTKAYEQSVQQGQAQSQQSSSSFFAQLGVDPKTWLTNLSNEGEEDVEGTETIHVHGDADVAQIFSDLGKVAQQAPGGAGTTLSPAQIGQLKSAIKEATVDVYSGQDDHLLRKLAVALDLAPPASAGSPVSSLKLDFSVTLSDVNEPQTITAPSNPKPIAELLQQLGLGGAGPLGSLGGASGGSLPGLPGGGGGPGQDYAQCLQEAKTPADFNKCAQQLQ